MKILKCEVRQFFLNPVKLNFIPFAILAMTFLILVSCKDKPNNPVVDNTPLDTSKNNWHFNSPCSPGSSVNLSVTSPLVSPRAFAHVSTPNDSGAGSLRALLSAAKTGDTLSFNPSLAGDTIHLKNEILITKNITLLGLSSGEIFLDGQNKVRIFSVNANQTFAIQGLTLINGHAVKSGDEPGGAINTGNACILKINRCNFRNNFAECGGAVRAGYETFTTIENCQFEANDGSQTKNGFSAGAISTNGHGELVVRHCNFINNKGNSGAAIYNLLEPITIEDCSFLGNISNNDGAAIFTDEGNWVGPSATKGGHIFVRHCWMEGNQSKAFGGACMLWANKLDTVNVENCVFKENNVAKGGQWNDSKGGAIRGNGILTVRNCSFIRNQAVAQGGALWLDGDGPVNIINSNFYGNKVIDDQGGAITLNTGGVVNILNCTLARNFAGRACGAFWFGDPSLPITITNSIVAFNTAGQDHGQDQIGYQPKDGGGNIEFPQAVNGGRKVAVGSHVIDPMLDSLTQLNGILALPLRAGSAAIDSAIQLKAPPDDIVQATRDSKPDIGAWEFRNATTGILCP